MAKKYDIITELYLRTIISLTDQQQWQRFLNTACYNFRLPFDEQVLLFAQRPEATAVLPIEGKNGWNQRFGRWVNRGSTGIAVFDGDTNGRTRLKYYFDIADTHPSRLAQPVPIWNVRQEHGAAIMEALENSFGELDHKETLAEALVDAARITAEDNLADYPNYLQRNAERVERGKLVDEFRSIIYDHNDYWEQIGDKDKCFDLYPVSECWSAFAQGKKTAYVYRDNIFILPAMQETMQRVIDAGVHHADRAREMLKKLDSDIPLCR